jgi:hypothetical protein
MFKKSPNTQNSMGLNSLAISSSGRQHMHLQ